MSTRVQKGGAVFKPVAKSRHRLSSTPSRHTSTPAPDNRSSMTPNISRDVTTPVPTQSPMPPPSVIPARSVSTHPSLVERSDPRRETPISSTPPSKVFPSFTSPNHIQKIPAIHPVLPPNPVALVPQGPSPPSVMVDTSSSTALTPKEPDIALSSQGNASATTMASSPMPGSSQLEYVRSFSQVPVTVPGEVSAVSYTTFDFHMTESISQIRRTDTPRRDVSESASLSIPRRNPDRRKRVAAIANSDSTPMTTAESSNIENSVNMPAAKRGSKRSSITAETEPNDGVTEPPKKRRRKTTNGPQKPRKPRLSSVPSYDPNADPGEEIDPTAITMAALCKDIGQGRVSSKAAQIQNNHAVWKASNREKRAKMKSLMESRKYGLTEDDPSPQATNTETTEAGADIPIESTSSSTHIVLPPAAQDDAPAATDESGHGFDYSQAVITSRYNVQVRIGPNGETVIDEESLFVDRNEDDGTENYTHVEESDTTKFVNSGTYGKKFRGSRWSAEETEMFFDALSQFGENYELISYILPGRDRTSCKNKFKAEDRKNPNRITYCLDNRRPYDMQTLSRMTGKDFSGPTPEIRAPVPLTLVEKPSEPHNTRKKSRTPHLGIEGEEIVGDVADFDEDKDD